MLNSYIICQLVSVVTQTVKNLPAMRETWVQSLGWEDPLKEMATHSNILDWVISSSWVISCSWIISGTEEPGGRQSTGSQRV